MYVTGEELPTIRHFNRYVLESVAPCWYQLGIHLLERNELNIIQNNQNSITAGCIEMFQLWLQRQPRASWNQLINLLKKSKINLKTLADKIEKELIRNPEIGMSVSRCVHI